MRFKYFLSSALLLFIINICSAQSQLKTGIWRGALKNSSGNELPF